MPESGLDLAQRRLLDVITERLVPSGDGVPGAREAKASRYIERGLSDDYRALLPAYIEGLAAIDNLAVANHRKPFVDLDPSGQDGVLAAVERGEAGAALQDFFEIVLRHTREGMFGDPAWGGNDGYAGWRLIGYPGPRYVWTEADQRLDVVVEPRYGDKGAP